MLAEKNSSKYQLSRSAGGAVSETLRNRLKLLARTVVEISDPERLPTGVGPESVIALLAALIAGPDSVRSIEADRGTDVVARLSGPLPGPAGELEAWLDSLCGGDLTRLCDAISELEPAVMPAESLAWLHRYIDDAGAEDGKHPADSRTGASPGHLRATQFFTDSYMVDHLVARSLGLVDSAEATVVDPACGGGNFLLAALRAMAPLDSSESDVARLLEGHLLGLDIDPAAAQVTSMALWAEATRMTGFDLPPGNAVAIGVESGRGFLDAEAGEFLAGEPGSGPRLMITNPPFMGRRVMPRELRTYLETQFPDSGNELCNAFLLRMCDLADPGDAIAAVHPLALYFLSSYGPAREALARSLHSIERVDLGTGAFRDLSGEKSSVALSVWRAGNAPTGREFDLTHLSRPEKEIALREIREEESGLGFARIEVPETSDSLLGDFADILQATSTGDAKRLVRPWWEIGAESEGWKPATKGGGSVRWAGLEHHMVNWGDSGEVIEAQPGSAIRNRERQGLATLTYGDNFSRGLAARRIERPETILVAGGPGIVTGTEQMNALLALLNSRYATWQLFRLTPKLVASPGYVGKIPMSSSALADPEIARLGRECADRALDLERLGVTRRDSDPMPEGDTGGPVAWMLRRLTLEAEILELELRLDALILGHHGVSGAGMKEMERVVGPLPPLEGPRRDEEGVSNTLIQNLAAGGRGSSRLRMLGIRGAVERTALESRTTPQIVLDAALRISSRPEFEELARDSYWHRSVVWELGLYRDEGPRDSGRRVADVAAVVADGLERSESELLEWISGRFERIHARSFGGRAPFEVAGDEFVWNRAV